MMVCNVELRKEFGNNRYYPINDIAVVFTDLLKSKTFTKRQLQTIKQKLGIEVGVYYVVNGNAMAVHEKDLI